MTSYRRRPRRCPLPPVAQQGKEPKKKGKEPTAHVPRPPHLSKIKKVSIVPILSSTTQVLRQSFFNGILLSLWGISTCGLHLMSLYFVISYTYSALTSLSPALSVYFGLTIFAAMTVSSGNDIFRPVWPIYCHCKYCKYKYTDRQSFLHFLLLVPVLP